MPIGLNALLALLDDERTIPHLRRYYGVGLAPGVAPAYTGGRFERLGGGGDRPEVRDRVTAEALIAVETLSVQVPPRVALDLLEGGLGGELSASLNHVPTEVTLSDVAARDYIADGGAADRAWRLLKAVDGIGWVIAGKVLARKRPLLIPVYDEVVRCAYGRPKPFWTWLHGTVRECDGALWHRLIKLRSDAGLPETVSPLRVLDAVLWMRHRSVHTHRACRGLAAAA